MINDLNFALIDLSFITLVIAIYGLLVEDQIAIRLILLLEISLAAVIGYSVALFGYLGFLGLIFAIIILVVAAVESIMLLCFIVVLHRLDKIVNLGASGFLQI